MVESCDANGMATLSLRNKFRAGDTVEVVGPDCKPFSMVVPEMRDGDGFTLLEPRNPRMIFTMQLRAAAGDELCAPRGRPERKGLKRKNAAIGR